MSRTRSNCWTRSCRSSGTSIKGRTTNRRVCSASSSNTNTAAVIRATGNTAAIAILLYARPRRRLPALHILYVRVPLPRTTVGASCLRPKPNLAIGALLHDESLGAVFAMAALQHGGDSVRRHCSAQFANDVFDLSQLNPAVACDVQIVLLLELHVAKNLHDKLAQRLIPILGTALGRCRRRERSLPSGAIPALARSLLCCAAAR
mmetsp:Transcript_154342/g.494955  ORF Transcript_154342/g.494955 Transcript_154342/m.494955 type:complete len:205 (-) Transcript_154342:438-1052(-)